MNYTNTDNSNDDNKKRIKTDSEHNRSEVTEHNIINSSNINLRSRALKSDNTPTRKTMLETKKQKQKLGEIDLTEDIPSIYILIDDNRTWAEVVRAENYLSFALEHCLYETCISWKTIESFLTHSTTMLTEDKRGIINVAMVTCTLQILSKLLDQTLTDEDLLEWFFEHKFDINSSLTALSKLTGYFWNKYYKYLGISGDIPACTDLNMPVRVRMCLDEFGKALYSCAKVYAKYRNMNLNAPEVAKQIQSSFGNCIELTLPKNIKRSLVLLFVLTLTDNVRVTKNMSDLQNNLLELFKII